MFKNKEISKLIKKAGKILLYQIILAILVGAAVEGTNIIGEKLLTNYKERQQLNKIDLGVSKKYIEKEWGIGPVNIKKNSERLEEEYFEFKNNIVRVVYDEEKVVAYFITNVTGKNKYKSNKNYLNSLKIYENTFDDVGIEGDVEVEVGTAVSGKYSFYNEIYGQGNELGYGNIYFSIWNYGNMENAEVDLITLAQKTKISQSLNNPRELIENELKVDRKKAKFNTVGVVADGYRSKIVNPDSDEFWLDTHRILTNFYRK